jgi:hypothetical protein
MMGGCCAIAPDVASMLHAMAESKIFFIVDKGINSLSLLGAQFVFLG